MSGDIRSSSSGVGPSPADDEIHVWPVSLETEPDYDILSPDERERAARFAFEHLRHRFASGRAALRRVLARYEGLSPEAILFDYGTKGKPFLRNSSLQFSASHCADRMLIAVARDRRVGIDLERVRDLDNLDGLIELACLPPERDYLGALAPAERLLAFFRIWTRKEAWIKAMGEGLASFDRVVAPLSPEREVTWVELGPGGEAAWSLRELEPGEGWIASVVVEGTLPRMTWMGE